MKVLLERTELEALVDKVLNFGTVRECSFPAASYNHSVTTGSTLNNLSS